LTPAGHVGVCPGINGVSYDNGLWVYGPDATVPRLVAGHGVDLPSPGAESTKYVWDWDLGPRGDVVAEIYTSEYDECLLYADPSGAASVLAHEDDPAPGLGAGLSWVGWSSPKLDATGRMAFQATVAGTGITGDNERLILRRETDGTLVRLAQEGDPAPDLADRWLGSDLRVLGINAAGDVLIQAQLRDADGSDLGDAYYRHATATSALELLIALGFGVPGVPGTTCEVLRGVQLNDAGFVFFAADLEGPGITSVNDEALWMRAPGEAAQLVLLEDGPIELPEIGLSGIVDDMQWSGYAPNVSADGRTAVCITVSHDGSRDDVLITVGAPEPATLALAGLGAACAALSRRRSGRRDRR
jgi:hypothetical protein